MKKNQIEERGEKLQNEKPSKTSSDVAGKTVVKYVLFILIIIAIALVVYYLTRINGNTFKVRSM